MERAAALSTVLTHLKTGGEGLYSFFFNPPQFLIFNFFKISFVYFRDQQMATNR